MKIERTKQWVSKRAKKENKERICLKQKRVEVEKIKYIHFTCCMCVWMIYFIQMEVPAHTQTNPNFENKNMARGSKKTEGAWEERKPEGEARASEKMCKACIYIMKDRAVCDFIIFFLFSVHMHVYVRKRD